MGDEWAVFHLKVAASGPVIIASLSSSSDLCHGPVSNFITLVFGPVRLNVAYSKSEIMISLIAFSAVPVPLSWPNNDGKKAVP